MKSPCQPEIGKFYDEKVKAKLVFLDLFLQVVLCCNIIPTILRWKSENQVSFFSAFFWSFAEEEYTWLIGLKYGLDDNDIISA